MEHRWKKSSVFHHSPPTVCHAACGTLIPSASVVRQRHFTDPHLHRCLSACVGLHDASSWLKINRRCVICGCLGNAAEKEEAGWKWVDYTRAQKRVDTSDSTVKWWVDVCSFSSSYYCAVSVFASAFVSLLCKDVQIIEHPSTDMPKLINHKTYLTTFKTLSEFSIYRATLKDSRGKISWFKHPLPL